MSGMVEKVKAKVDNVLHKDKSHDDPSGPHSSATANQADPRVDSDHAGAIGNSGSAAHGTTHTGTTGTHTGVTGTHAGTTGTHTGMTGTHTGTTDASGPHDSRMANKADPRVDSDRVGTAGNYGSAAPGTTHTGTTGTHTGMTGTHVGSTGTDPHNSHLANQADPRVGGVGSTTHGTTGMTGAHSGTAGTHVASTGYSDPSGPHDSRMANKADPRVDSDRVGTAGNYGSAAPGTTHTGVTGAHTGMTGTHNSHLANQADPRVGGVGSTTHGTTGMTGAHTGMTGTHAGTTGTHTGMTGTHVGSTGTDPSGPHNSHLANKADPRVDSDRVGSAGNMGSAAHGTTGTTGTHGNLAHRDNENGDLPKALVEPQSHAVPHSSTTGAHGTTGTHGTTDVHGTHGTEKPSMMDKLNPKKDADFDGKRGVFD